MTTEQKARISAGLMGRTGYWKGKHVSDETKQKISNTMKGKVSPMKGKKWDNYESRLEAVRKSIKEQWQNPDNIEKFRKTRSERMKKRWTENREIMVSYMKNNRPPRKLGRWQLMSKDELHSILLSYRDSRMNINQFASKIHTDGHKLGSIFRKHFAQEYQEIVIRNRKVITDDGRHFELRVRKYLMNNGYFVIINTPSRGPVDLVATKGTELLFLQCKVSSNIFYGKKKELFIKICKHNNARPIFATRNEPPKYELQFIDVTKNEYLKFEENSVDAQKYEELALLYNTPESIS